MKIRECKAIVEKILEDVPEARGCDNILVLEVIKAIDPSALDRPIKEILPQCHVNGRFPPFETIRRTRQKLQERNENLRADEEIEGLRALQEHKFFEFAISRRS